MRVYSVCIACRVQSSPFVMVPLSLGRKHQVHHNSHCSDSLLAPKRIDARSTAGAYLGLFELP